jgi:hypothetical protein
MNILPTLFKYIKLLTFLGNSLKTAEDMLGCATRLGGAGIDQNVNSKM